jgi:hypothetical protein
VFSIIGREADAATWAQLHERARAEDSFEQKRALYAALGTVRDPALAKRTLALSITDELIAHDAARLVSRVAHEGEQPELAWNFARQHLDTLLAKLPSNSVNYFVPGIFEAFDDNDLAFLYQADRNSRFCKLVSRDSVDLDDDEEEARAPKSNGKHRSVHAIQLLERQHREVEGLFERFFQADTNDAKERLFARLADHLAAHSMIEETIFYPEVLDGETEEILQNAVNEHREIKRILAELLDQEIDVDFDAQMGDLQSEVEHHIEEEETQLFEILGHVPRESFMEMGERLKERFDALFRAEPRYDVPSEIRGPARV